MGATVHSHSLASRGSAAAAVVLRGCASSRISINPASIAKPAAAVAKISKRPGSFHDGDPPAKHARGACGVGEPDAATKTKARPRPSSHVDRCPLGSLRDGVEANYVTKNQASASPVRLPELAEAPPKPPATTMRELLERARLAMARSADPATDAEDVRRREIERQRAEARREREQMVHPFIDVLDVFN